MAILPDLSYARTRSTFVPRNLEILDSVGAGLEAQYNANKDRSSLLLGQLDNIQVRNPNVPILEKVKSDITKELDDIATAGDYENADLRLTQLARRVNNDPLLKGAIKDYDNYSAYQKSLGELKNVEESRKNEALGYSNATNNKMVEFDPTLGYKNVYSGYNPTETPDFNKIVGEFADKIKTSKSPLELGKDAQGNPVYMQKINNSYYVSGKKEALDENEARKIIEGHVATNPQMTGYLKENLMFDKFKRKFDPATGTYQPFTTADFGEEEAFNTVLKAQGIDPTEFNEPSKLEALYDNAFMEAQISSISDPYARAVSKTDIELDYKQDSEWLNKQKNQLALGTALAKIKAKEASDKRVMDYKYKKDAEVEERLAGKLVLSNPIVSEPINFAVAEKNLESVDMDLKQLIAKKEASSKGLNNTDGSPIMLSVEENNKIKELQDTKKRLTYEKAAYMNNAVVSEAGLGAINRAYNNYVAATKNPEALSLEDFSDMIREDKISNPKQIVTSTLAQMRTGMEGQPRNDPKDINTYLTEAKTQLKTDPLIMETVNKKISNEANSYWASDESMTTDKASTLAKVKRTLTNNILSQGGIGYDVIGSGERLVDVLQQHLESRGEDKFYNGKKVTVTTSPVDRPLTGVTDEDLMYEFIIRDEKTGALVKSALIRPTDQASHSDLMYNMNQDLVANYDESTKIGKAAMMGIQNYELPQFQIGQNRAILDGQVNRKSQRGQIGVGTMIPYAGANYTFVKTKTPIVDHYTDDDPNHPVTVIQDTYHLVRLRDGLPADTPINADNIKNYLPAGVNDWKNSAIINNQNVADPKNLEYGKKNLDFATGFKSLEDARDTFYKTTHKQ